MVEIKYASVGLDEVMASQLRFEANVFHVDARNAREILKNCKWDVVNLLSDEGLVASAFYPGRFKRIYVDKGNGYPMILPSQMLEAKPKPSKYISKKTFDAIGNLSVQADTLLITRSGTIGNSTIVTKSLERYAMSDDVIRIKFKEEYDLGYTYAYLKTDIGLLMLTVNNYGSVIQHIEPEHLENVQIPNPPASLKKKIHDLIIKSFSFRDQANFLIDEAENILVRELKLPPMESLPLDMYDANSPVKTFEVPLSSLNNRFDGSYHTPVANSLIDYFLDYAESIQSLGDLCTDITMPGIFKRVYVDKEQGVPFLGTTDIKEINPKIDKYLSSKFHAKLIKEDLALKQNTILQANRGSVSVGDVILVPSYFEELSWVASQNSLRIVPKSNGIAGYIYIFLNSEYGNVFSRREIYGAVIDMIDPQNVKQIPIPILKNKNAMQQINDLAFQANNLRSKAYYSEIEALKIVNDEVIFS